VHEVGGDKTDVVTDVLAPLPVAQSMKQVLGWVSWTNCGNRAFRGRYT